MNRKKAWILIILTLVVAVIVPLSLQLFPAETRTHTLSLEAKKYGYSPSRIIVNQGDKIVLKPTSLDATHGFLLDGHPVEFIMRKGATFLKYTWEDENGKLQADWDRVSEVEFVTNKAGKFTFRCTQTCGNLHPFMTGELIVKPNHPYYFFISLSIWLVFSLLVYFRTDTGSSFSGFKRINLLEKFPWLKKIVKLRSFHFLIILPNFIVFYLFIVSSLWGSPVGNRNIAIIFVWILWWFVLKAIIVPLGGRIWCMVCPLPAPSEWLSRKSFTAVRYIKQPFKTLHHRFTGLQKDWPKLMDNIWLQNILFLALISFGIILITRPIATALLFLIILVMSLLLALIYRRRVFCQYLCPVGGFLGTYAMASMTELRAVDVETCKKHKEKSCYAGGPGGWACPWKQYIGTMKRNNYCGLCTECIKSCPKDNLGVFIRPFGADRKLKGYDEMFNVIIMLVVAIVFSITMSGPWSVIKNAANVTESRQILPFLIYVAVIWILALGVFPGIFALVARTARRFAGSQEDNRTVILRLAYILIPIGIFAWIAFSLPMLMVNYGYILNVLSDPLGLGWDILSTADFPFQPFYPQSIPLIQGLILLCGLYLGLSRGYLSLKDIIPSPNERAKAMVIPSIFALLVVNIFLRLYMG
ncbi:MAG: 4Fe-4S binding protein [Desulfobacterales bacterium]|jgi:heme/copper-type cytochrome/quinol oxidase subunit 2